MKRILKYKIEAIGEQSVEMPLGAEILTVQIQNGEPHIWAMVEDGFCPLKYRIRTFGTGHEIPSDFIGKHIGTYQTTYGGFVFHVFQS